MLKFIRTFKHSLPLPSKKHLADAGLDLRSAVDVVIPAQSRRVVSTGWSWHQRQINMYGRIAPRSGLAVNHGIDVLAGVVDAGYQGEIKVVLYNTGSKDFKVAIGDRIAQLIIEQCVTTHVVREASHHLLESGRSTDGFGSTGVQ